MPPHIVAIFNEQLRDTSQSAVRLTAVQCVETDASEGHVGISSTVPAILTCHNHMFRGRLHSCKVICWWPHDLPLKANKEGVPCIILLLLALESKTTLMSR